MDIKIINKVAASLLDKGETSLAQEVLRLAEHTSSIFMIKVPEDVWSKLSAKVPNPVDEVPHITLAYMPEATEDEIDQARVVALRLLKDIAPIPIQANKADQFDTTQDDDTIPHFAAIESPELILFRQKLVEALNSEIREDLVDIITHSDYIPHITLQYVEQGTELPQIEPVEWEATSCVLSHKDESPENLPFGL